MNTTTSTVKLPPQIAQDLAALEKRARMLTTRGGRLVAGAAATGALTAVAYGLAYWLGPTATLSSIHVPVELLNMFPEASGSGMSGGTPFENAAAIQGVLSGVFPKFVAVLGLIAGGFFTVIRGEIKYIIMPFMGSALIFIAPTMLGAIIGSDSEPTQQSDRKAFINIIKAGNERSIEIMLQGVKAPAHFQDYVLAQAALVQAHKSNKALDSTAMVTVVDRVRRVDDALIHGTAPTLSGEALYALEVAAMEGAKSKPAKAYYAKAVKNAELSSGVGFFGALSTIAMLLFGGGILTVGKRMRARVARIRPLLGGQATATATPTIVEKQPAAKTGALSQDQRIGVDWVPPHQRRPPAFVPAAANGSSDDGIGLGTVAMAVGAAALFAEAVDDDTSCRSDSGHNDSYTQDNSDNQCSSSADDSSSTAD